MPHHKSPWIFLITLAVVLSAVATTIRHDLRHLEWAKRIVDEGSPAPKTDTESSTGYDLETRHFLGVKNRGETYRWIDYTQEMGNSGFLGERSYKSDTVPTGRPQLLPKLYSVWLFTLAKCIQLSEGSSFPFAVEGAAYWEPLVVHSLVVLLFTAIVALNRQPVATVLCAITLALYPSLSAQFIPGSLNADTAASLLAALAIALSFRTESNETYFKVHSVVSSILAGLSLCLNPAYGFTVALLVSSSRIPFILRSRENGVFLRWTLIGVVIATCGCLLDANPLATSTSELRYNHILYPIAWLGFGILIQSAVNLRRKSGGNLKNLIGSGIGVILCGSLFYQQLKGSHSGWLYSDADLQRLSPLDETVLFSNLFDWAINSSPLEIVFLLSLPLIALTVAFRKAFFSRNDKRDTGSYYVNFLLLLLTGILAYYKIRWALPLNLISIVYLCGIARECSPLRTRIVLAGSGVYLFTLFAWQASLPNSLRRSQGDDALGFADEKALVYRHLAHWIASHYQNRIPQVLASPELSDSLIFHGNCRTLLSTAWESYPGQVAASRILSAPEDSEVEALLESREVSLIALPSWDAVIPLLIQSPKEEDDDTFFERLDRWVLPRFLRPIPYQLPPLAGLETEKLPLFQWTLYQDDALALSRLTEYFVEMRRKTPAELATETLNEFYPTDTNSHLARAMVAADSQDVSAFEAQIEALTTPELLPLVDWDRRVQRAILLDMAKKRELVTAELKALMATVNEDALFALTPLQSFQFLRLIQKYELSFTDRSLLAIALARCSEYLP